MQLLGSCSKAVARSPRWVIIGFAILFAVSASMMLRLRVSPDISALMPAHSRVSGALLEALADFGATDRLILVIESTDAEAGPLIAKRDQLKSLADRVADGIADTGMFSSIAHRITADEQRFFEDLRFRHPFHYHSPERLQELQPTLNPQEIARRVNDLRRTLRASPFGVTSQQQLLRDPLGFRSAPGAGYDHDNLTGLELDLSDGYFFSLDGTALLILAKPLAPSQDAAFDAALLERIAAVLGRVGGSGTFRGDFSMEVAPDFRVQLIGPYVETLYGAQTAAREIVPSIAATGIGLVILFGLVYRNLLVLLILAVPLLTGIVMTGGMASLYAGHLTMITVGFATMLAGLGVDFEIHLVERMGQESLAGGDTRESIATAFTTAGRGVLAGGFTTAAIFLLIATSDFMALREFGWIMGIGILLIMISVFALLPVLLAAFPMAPRAARHASGFGWLPRIVSHYRWVCVLGGALTLALGYSATMLRLESNIYDLGPVNSAYEQQKDRLLEKVGGSTNVVMVVAERENLQELLELSEQIKAAVEDLQASDGIDSFESLSSILPSRKAQWEIIRTVRQWDLSGAMTSFRDALAEAGFRTAPFEPFIARVLDYSADAYRTIELDDLQGTPAEELASRLLVRKASGWRAVTYLYPRPGQWEDEVPASVVRSIEGLGPGIVLTGIVPSFNEISAYVSDEFLGLALSALAVVLLISLVFFRQPRVAALAVMPAILGLVWTLGLMQLFGIELNLVTILVAPMIVGLGIDDALHVLNRQRENPADLAGSVSAVARAVLLTTATTIIGFGSLAFADLSSLRALGITVSIGMACCAVTSLLVLPAIQTAFGARH
jgi:predicted RND superfamily exporter protein